MQLDKRCQANTFNCLLVLREIRVRKKRLKLNLPSNFRKDVLFNQLPYLARLENTAIADVVKNGITDYLSLQKYLLATGLLKDSIQDSLEMIASDDRKLSNAVVRRQLDTKFPCHEKT